MKATSMEASFRKQVALSDEIRNLFKHKALLYNEECFFDTAEYMFWDFKGIHITSKHQLYI